MKQLEQLDRVPKLEKKFSLDYIRDSLLALDVLVSPLGYLDTH